MPSSTAMESIPCLAHAFCFILQVADAGSTPTKIVANVGVIPFFFNLDTLRFISSSANLARVFRLKFYGTYSFFIIKFYKMEIDYLTLNFKITRLGVWRSLVAHSLWERVVASSNFTTPTSAPVAQLDRQRFLNQNEFESLQAPFLKPLLALQIYFEY